jgi:hypothetical protein
MKAAYLSDAEVTRLARIAAEQRRAYAGEDGAEAAG